MDRTSFDRVWFTDPLIARDFEPVKEHYGLVLAPYEFRFTMNIRDGSDQIFARQIYMMIDSYHLRGGGDGAELHYYLESCRLACTCSSTIYCNANLEQKYRINVEVHDIERFMIYFEEFMYGTLNNRCVANTILGINPNTGEDLLALLEGGMAEC